MNYGVFIDENADAWKIVKTENLKKRDGCYRYKLELEKKEVSK